MAIIIVRTLIIYIALIMSMRIMGKRQLGELEISELVVAVVIADMTAMPLQDIGIPLINGLIPLIMLLCCEILVTGAATKSIRLRYILFGRPSILIENGVICQKEMRKNRFTVDELYEELRQQSITDISKVQQAILETGGILNIILFPSEQPVTARQLNIPCPESGIPIILINEGRVLSDNLTKIGQTRQWLQERLNAHHVQSPDKVYLYSIDPAGNDYMAKMESDL